MTIETKKLIEKLHRKIEEVDAKIDEVQATAALVDDGDDMFDIVEWHVARRDGYVRKLAEIEPGYRPIFG